MLFVNPLTALSFSKKAKKMNADLIVFTAAGSLERRVERLKRFTDATNKRYAAEILLEEARQRAMEEQEQRVQQRIRELEQEVEIPMVCEFIWSTHPNPNHDYNLRSTRFTRLQRVSDMPLHLLQAIENGHVKTRRG